MEDTENKSLQQITPNRDHLSIEITKDHEDLLSSITRRIESISLSQSISRVPEHLSKGYEQFYNPTLVSIGPLHHNKFMEDQKWRYLNALFSRKTDAESSLESCITALRHAEHKVRIFYGEMIEKGSDQIVEMMLLDGCFIIELFLEYTIKTLRRRDDPLFSSNDTIFRLRCDLMLFENQLPFFVLEQLFRLVPIPKQNLMSLTELALCFFNKLLPKDSWRVSDHQVMSPKPIHFLDLIRQHYLPTYPKPHSSCRETQAKQIQIQIHKATQISALGIKIERAISQSPSNIKFFDEKLKIPSLEIHCYTEILFRNLIAMELCQPKCSKHISSYVILMGQLIQSKRDVGLLQDKGILIDDHYKEDEIVLLFMKLIVDLNVKDFYYKGLCEEINGFKKRENGWKSIRHVYHRSGLGIAGLCLAVVFLVFILVGGLCSGLTFLLHHFQ